MALLDLAHMGVLFRESMKGIIEETRVQTNGIGCCNVCGDYPQNFVDLHQLQKICKSGNGYTVGRTVCQHSHGVSVQANDELAPAKKEDISKMKNCWQAGVLQFYAAP